MWRFPASSAVTSGNLSVVLLEDQRDGQLIGRWSLDCLLEDAWAPCHTNDEGVGHKRIVNVVIPGGDSTGDGSAANGTVSISAMRLNVLSHYAMPGQVPRLRALEVYDWASATHCV